MRAMEISELISTFTDKRSQAASAFSPEGRHFSLDLGDALALSEARNHSTAEEPRWPSDTEDLSAAATEDAEQNNGRMDQGEVRNTPKQKTTESDTWSEEQSNSADKDETVSRADIGVKAENSETTENPTQTQTNQPTAASQNSTTVSDKVAQPLVHANPDAERIQTNTDSTSKIDLNAATIKLAAAKTGKQAEETASNLHATKGLGVQPSNASDYLKEHTAVHDSGREENANDLEASIAALVAAQNPLPAISASALPMARGVNGSAQQFAAMPTALQAAAQNSAQGGAAQSDSQNFGGNLPGSPQTAADSSNGALKMATAARPLFHAPLFEVSADGSGTNNQTATSGTSGIGSSTSAQNMQAAKAASLPRALPMPTQTSPATMQVAINIAQAVADGASRIGIRLQPAELGRVEVSLEIRADGRVQAAILADRPETLDLLRNDSRHLERALEDAGLNLNSGGLEFGLREQQDETANRGKQNSITPLQDPENEGAAAEIVPPPWMGDLANWRNGALDIRV